MTMAGWTDGTLLLLSQEDLTGESLSRIALIPYTYIRYFMSFGIGQVHLVPDMGPNTCLELPALHY